MLYDLYENVNSWYHWTMISLSKEEIGRRIRDLRFRNKKSQEALGQHLGKSHAAVSDIERGRTELSAIDLAKIAEFFDVTVDSIVSEVPSYMGTFSHHRADRGLSNTEIEQIKKAQEEFRKKAKEQVTED